MFLYFNKINGFREARISIKNPLTGGVLNRIGIFPIAEEPYVCMSGGGTTVDGQPYPQQFTCSMGVSTNQKLAGVREENLERMHKAIDYLYSQYCKFAKKKNAF